MGSTWRLVRDGLGALLALTESGVFWLQGSELVRFCWCGRREARREAGEETGRGRQGRRSDAWEEWKRIIEGRIAGKGRVETNFLYCAFTLTPPSPP